MGRKENEEHPAGRDAVAEALEAAGLYLRAARRWLDVLDRCRDSEERAWLAARRSQCLENARKPEPATEYFEDVMYTGQRPTRRNEWVSMHKRGSEGIPLTVAPQKNRHADHRGTAAR